MGSRAALQDPVGPALAPSGQVVTPHVAAARPLDPLIAALSQAARRSGPAKPHDQKPDTTD